MSTLDYLTAARSALQVLASTLAGEEYLTVIALLVETEARIALARTES